MKCKYLGKQLLGRKTTSRTKKLMKAIWSASRKNGWGNARYCGLRINFVVHREANSQSDQMHTRNIVTENHPLDLLLAASVLLASGTDVTLPWAGRKVGTATAMAAYKYGWTVANCCINVSFLSTKLFCKW